MKSVWKSYIYIAYIIYKLEYLNKNATPLSEYTTSELKKPENMLLYESFFNVSPDQYVIYVDIYDI